MDIIEMPDGTKVDMTGAPPEAHAALRAKIQAQVADNPQAFALSPPPAKKEEPAGFLESTGRDLATGLGQASGIVGHGVGYAADAFLPEGAGKWLHDKTNVAEKFWQGVGDKSTNNDYVKATLRGIGGAPVMGGVTPIGLVAGGTGGLGAEIGDKLAGGKAPLAALVGGIIGGVVGGGGASLLARARPQSGAVAREAMEGLTEADLRKAQDYKNQLAAQNVDVDLAQALIATKGHAGNIESLRNFLANRSEGNAVQKTLRDQPSQLGMEAEMTSAGLPGRNYSPEQNANNIQEAATSRLKQATDSRSSTVKGMYAGAGDLPPEARTRLGAVLNKYAMEPGATDVMKSRAKEMADKLLGNDPKLGQAVVDARESLKQAGSASERMAAQKAFADANAAQAAAKGAPLRALDVDTWINELRGPWQGQPLKIAYPKEQGQIKGLAGALNQEFQALSPKVAAAEKTFRDITRSEVDPLKQGVIGQLSQPRGYDPATQAAVSKMTSLFDRGTDPTAQQSSIRTAGRELAKVDPDAFASSFKQWVSGKVQGALKTPVGDGNLSNDPGMAQGLYDGLFKEKKTWQGIRDATSIIAETQGKNPAEVIAGLESLKKMTSGMQSRPPTGVGGMSPNDLSRLGGNSNIANAVRVFSFLPINKLGEGIERATLGKTLQQMDTILTSPEGVDMLIKLGKVPVMSRAAQTILGTWGGLEANPAGLPANNP